MASPARAIQRRLGQLATQTRGPSVSLLSGTRASLANNNAWICRRCTAQLPKLSRRAFTQSAAPAADVDVNHIPQSRKAIVAYAALDTFARRHIGPDDADTAKMLKALSPAPASLDDFIKEVIPANILTQQHMQVKIAKRHDVFSESELVQKFHTLKNLKGLKTITSFIGAGYYGTITPAVIKRNILENPAWYTSYTPYQPEISQGRLESLVNFQTMVCDLTALPISNASLLDEGTAAAEAMTMSMNGKEGGKTFVVSDTVHAHTVRVLHGRAEGFGIRILKVPNITSEEGMAKIKELGDDLVGVTVQYPDTFGDVANFKELADVVHSQGSLLSCATDLLALTLLKPPGEWGADIAFGSAQRFGVPMGFGGPHAAFFAVTEKNKRKIPGRLVGLSKDRLGNNAYRLALQTREQHIRREKATSNVCTSQALLANMSALYAVYHGPEGLKAIAERTVRGARVIQEAAESCGLKTIKSAASSSGAVLFDTVIIDAGSEEKQQSLHKLAEKRGFQFRNVGATQIGISIDETTSRSMLISLVEILQMAQGAKVNGRSIVGTVLTQSGNSVDIPEAVRRTSSFLTHPVFNTHHSETELLRYIYHLQSKDLSLVHSMIPLGSCTMKLNGTTEMSLITDEAFSTLHPHSSANDSRHYDKLFQLFTLQLASITGMQNVSLQPNSGAQGEFAGLRTIRSYLKKHGKGDKKRDICLIPISAHGTNPASAAMAGMRVVPSSNLDLEDLEAKCQAHQDELGAIMVTYPSTYGVFEPEIKRVCELVHEHGGQVYMDGANMNAQIGLCSPGEIGADVCHLNLHKTFCIPHGGGGPGVGPICVKKHLAEHLPGSALEESGPYPVSSANHGSASINLISWAYNTLMGSEGLTHATKIGLLNANYLLSRLKPHYSILYTNNHGRCAHEFILDVRPFSKSAGVEAIDIAKRLQDYGFHAPTMSWPVAGTLMIEPTESESKEELDRFIDALVSIRAEIKEVEDGKVPRENNVLKNSPHPVQDIIDGDGEGKWERSYTREKATYPLPYLREKKFWPSVGRIDDTYGDMNLFCTCPPVEDTTSED
ncbi:glycine dehydrogenase (decarboxylating) [Apiospora phragmitis]|uniref:Glycine cleavage system P protein n=1 Tax=Apiospora phragmitis TaxID=2905665 RepID=A0ABR1USU6_9PEZI